MEPVKKHKLYCNKAMISSVVKVDVYDDETMKTHQFHINKTMILYIPRTEVNDDGISNTSILLSLNNEFARWDYWRNNEGAAKTSQNLSCLE